MRNDDLMDPLLRDAMAADVPQLSTDFDERVMERVRPRRLSAMGRVAIAAYAVAAAATTVWLMQGLGTTLIVAAMAVTATVAAGTSVYVRQLADSR